MKTICIIPARLASKRFPRKVLSTLGSQPLLKWVWDAATRCEIFDEVVFAVDSKETARLIESFGGRFLMTSENCLTGTDRLIELMERKEIEGDIWVNWQADEPFIEEAMIRDLLQTTEQKKFDIWSLKKKIEKEDEIDSSHVVKVVTDVKRKALYFSRSPIPYYRDTFEYDEMTYYKHIGIYAFTKKALKKISRLKASNLEIAEQLEQLRFLENGLNIEVHETIYETLGIDHPEDLIAAHEKVSFCY